MCGPATVCAKLPKLGPMWKSKNGIINMFFHVLQGECILKVVIRNTWVSYMNGNCELTQARNTKFEGK